VPSQAVILESSREILMPFSAHHRVTGLVHAGPALLWLVLLALSLPLLPAASRCRAAGSTDAYPAPPTVAELRGLIEQAGEPGYTRSVKVRGLELPLPFDVDSVRGGREVSRGALSIRKGRIHLQRLEDRGGVLYHLFLKGSLRMVFAPADSLEALSLQAGMGRPGRGIERISRDFSAAVVSLLKSRGAFIYEKVGSVHVFCRNLPAELAELEWRDCRPFWLTRWMWKRKAARIRRSVDPHPILDCVLHGARFWLQCNKRDFTLRSRRSEGGAVVTQSLRAAHSGSIVFQPLTYEHTGPGLPAADIARHATVRSWTPPSCRVENQRLVLRADPARNLRWTTRLEVELAEATGHLSFRLDPAAELDSLRVTELGPAIRTAATEFLRIRAGGPLVEDSPLVLIPLDSLRDGRLAVDLHGSSAGSLVVTHSLRRDMATARCWYPAPADLDRVPEFELPLSSPQRFTWWTPHGRVPVCPDEGEAILGRPNHKQHPPPGLHFDQRPLLECGPGLTLAYTTPRDQRAGELRRVRTTTQWSYEDDLLAKERRFRPADPVHDEESPSPGVELLPASPGEGSSQPGDTLAESLLRESELQAELQAYHDALGRILGSPQGRVLLLESRGAEPDRATTLRESFLRGGERRFPNQVRGRDLWSITPESRLALAEALAGHWWGGEIMVSRRAPRWLRAGLIRSSALLALEDLGFHEEADALRKQALERMLNRFTPHGSSSILALGDRAEGHWRAEEVLDRMAWRFALQLENLRWRLRDPLSLSDSLYRDWLRDLAVSHLAVDGGGPSPVVPLDLASFISESEVFLDQPGRLPWGQEFRPWMEAEMLRARRPTFTIRLGAADSGDGPRTVMHVSRSDCLPHDRFYIPVLLRSSEGKLSLLTLVSSSNAQQFELPGDPGRLGGIRFGPGSSLAARIRRL